MAKVTFKAPSNLAQSIAAIPRAHRSAVGFKLIPKTEDARKYLEAMGGQDEFLRGVLRDVVMKELLGPGGELHEQFHQRYRTPHKYYAEYITADGEVHAGSYRKSRAMYEAELRAEQMGEHYDSGRTTKVSGSSEGTRHSRLWQSIKANPVFETRGTLALANIGHGSSILSHRLNDMSNSPFNSLFYATEFGTGRAKYVGGHQWVRRTGKTKEPDGSWWFGATKGSGIHMAGQYGYHFLYDATTRKPLPYYIDRIREKLPEHLREKIKDFDKHFATTR